jgi:hypothetical protein
MIRASSANAARLPGAYWNASMLITAPAAPAAKVGALEGAVLEPWPAGQPSIDGALAGSCQACGRRIDAGQPRPRLPGHPQALWGARSLRSL